MGQFPEASQLLKGLHADNAIFIWSAASSIQKENFWTEDELLIQKHKKYCWKWNLGNEILSDNTAFQLPYALWDNWIKVQWSQGQATLCWHSDIMIQYYIIKKINRSWLYHDVTLTAECTAQCYPYLCSCEHDQLSCPRSQQLEELSWSASIRQQLFFLCQERRDEVSQDEIRWGDVALLYTVVQARGGNTYADKSQFHPQSFSPR